jgi:3-isopropylmalate/(R)-2-methylmalate dehydratase small subunit
VEPFTTLTGVAAPFPIANVDTDMIAPGDSMKTVTKDGLAAHLFARLRYRADGREDPDFVLNRPAYRNARILVAHDNFGCGSSREHAVWALREFGIRCVIAPSFADIFFLNAFRNGLLLISLDADSVERLLLDAGRGANATFTVNLEKQVIVRPDGDTQVFDIDPFRRDFLLAGRTDAERIVETRAMTTRFEKWQRSHRPWLWEPGR